MKKIKWTTLLGIVILICFIAISIIIHLGQSTLSNSPMGSYKDISTFRKSFSFQFLVPSIIESEPNINYKSVMGQIAEIENEHIKFRAAQEIPSGADINGMYEECEVDKQFLDKSTNIEYRARGDKDKIYYINWEALGIKYGIWYKPGLEATLAFKYIDADINNMEEQEKQGETEKIEEISDYTIEENKFSSIKVGFSIELPVSLGNNPIVNIQDTNTAQNVTFMIGKPIMQTLFTITKQPIELEVLNKNEIIYSTKDANYILKYTTTNPFEKDTIEYEAFSTIEKQMEKVKESFKIIQ